MAAIQACWPLLAALDLALLARKAPIARLCMLLAIRESLSGLLAGECEGVAIGDQPRELA